MTAFCLYVIQRDINKIALDLREAHKDDFFSVSEDNPLEDFLQIVDEAAGQTATRASGFGVYLCKRLKLNLSVSEEEKSG